MSYSHPTSLPTEVEAWLLYQTSYTSKELDNGDGNHPDEIDALRKLLDGTYTTQQAAVAITAPLAREEYRPLQQYRLWGLLVDAISEQGQIVSQKSLELLLAIEALPPTPQIAWSDLTIFGNLWSDMNSSQFHGSPPWEHGQEGVLADERSAELCRLYQDQGVAEASMWLRIPDAISPNHGYEVLNLSRSGRPGLYVYVYQIRGWLRVAGLQLRGKMQLDKVMKLVKKRSEGFANATMNGRGR